MINATVKEFKPGWTIIEDETGELHHLRPWQFDDIYIAIGDKGKLEYRSNSRMGVFFFKKND